MGEEAEKVHWPSRPSKSGRTRLGDSGTEENFETCNTGKLMCTSECQCQSGTGHRRRSTCGTQSDEENAEEQTQLLATQQGPVPDQGPTRQTETVAGKPTGSASADPWTPAHQQAQPGPQPTHGRGTALERLRNGVGRSNSEPLRSLGMRRSWTGLWLGAFKRRPGCATTETEMPLWLAGCETHFYSWVYSWVIGPCGITLRLRSVNWTRG